MVQTQASMDANTKQLVHVSFQSPDSACLQVVIVNALRASKNTTRDTICILFSTTLRAKKWNTQCDIKARAVLLTGDCKKYDDMILKLSILS